MFDFKGLLYILWSMPPAGWEPTFPAGERPQNHTLDGAATEIGSWAYIFRLNKRLLFMHAVDEMALSIIDKLFELCKMMIWWKVECDLKIDHYSF